MNGIKAEEKTLVVADKPMRFGDRIRSENLKAIPWPSNETPAGSFVSIEAVVGSDAQPRYAMAAIDPGKPVLSSKITGAGERATLSAALDQGMKAVSIRVNDVLGVAGFVRPSDRVDVLLTRVVRGPAGNDQSLVDVLLQGVKVLAVDQTADERKDEPSVVKTVTFEVTTDEAQRLTLGSSIGTLSLALRNIASSSIEQTRQIAVADLGGGAMAAELGNDLEKNKLPEPEKQVQIVEPKVEPGVAGRAKVGDGGGLEPTKRKSTESAWSSDIYAACRRCGRPKEGAKAGMANGKRRIARTKSLAALAAVFSACVCLWPGFAGSASAQEKSVTLGKSVQHVTLPPNETLTLNTGQPFGDLVIGSADMIDVVPLSDRSLFIRGKKTGATNISVYGDDKSLLGVIDIRVASDFTEVAAAIRSAAPSARVRVVNSNDRIRLVGVVRDSIELQRVLEIAQSYSEQPVLNQLRVSDSQQVMLEVLSSKPPRTDGS